MLSTPCTSTSSSLLRFLVCGKRGGGAPSVFLRFVPAVGATSCLSSFFLHFFAVSSASLCEVQKLSCLMFRSSNFRWYCELHEHSMFSQLCSQMMSFFLHFFAVSSASLCSFRNVARTTVTMRSVGMAVATFCASTVVFSVVI